MTAEPPRGARVPLRTGSCWRAEPNPTHPDTEGILSGKRIGMPCTAAMRSGTNFLFPADPAKGGYGHLVGLGSHDALTADHRGGMAWQ